MTTPCPCCTAVTVPTEIRCGFCGVADVAAHRHRYRTILICRECWHTASADTTPEAVREFQREREVAA